MFKANGGMGVGGRLLAYVYICIYIYYRSNCVSLLSALRSFFCYIYIYNFSLNMLTFNLISQRGSNWLLSNPMQYKGINLCEGRSKTSFFPRFKSLFSLRSTHEIISRTLAKLSSIMIYYSHTPL